MTENEKMFGWFVRPVATPISIRDIRGNRVTVHKDEFVFGEVKYLYGMPGMVYLPNFKKSDLAPSQHKLIRSDMPVGFENYSPASAPLADFQELNIVDVNDENDVIYDDDDEENYVDPEDMESTEISVNLKESENGEYEADISEKEKPETDSDININVLIETKKKYPSSKEWFSVTKQQAKAILDEANVDYSHINDAKWDLIRFIKKLIKEIDN